MKDAVLSVSAGAVLVFALVSVVAFAVIRPAAGEA